MSDVIPVLGSADGIDPDDEFTVKTIHGCRFVFGPVLTENRGFVAD